MLSSPFAAVNPNVCGGFDAEIVQVRSLIEAELSAYNVIRLRLESALLLRLRATPAFTQICNLLSGGTSSFLITLSGPNRRTRATSLTTRLPKLKPMPLRVEVRHLDEVVCCCIACISPALRNSYPPIRIEQQLSIWPPKARNESHRLQRALAVRRTAAARRSQIAARSAISLSELTQRGGRHLPYRRGFRVRPSASHERLTIAAVAVRAQPLPGCTPRSFRRTRPPQKVANRRCSEARRPVR